MVGYFLLQNVVPITNERCMSKVYRRHGFTSQTLSDACVHHTGTCNKALVVVLCQQALCPWLGVGLGIEWGGTIFLLILRKATFIGHHLLGGGV